jgi:DnaJ-class molecular chaperone
MGKDYYKILGVPRNASKQDLKKAYKKLVLEWHPDRNKNPNAETLMKEINLAWEVLSNDVLRKQYDMYGEEGVAASSASREDQTKSGGSRGIQGGAGFEVDLNDIFESFFGGGGLNGGGQSTGRSRRSGPVQGT